MEVAIKNRSSYSSPLVNALAFQEVTRACFLEEYTLIEINEFSHHVDTGPSYALKGISTLSFALKRIVGWSCPPSGYERIKQTINKVRDDRRVR